MLRDLAEETRGRVVVRAAPQAPRPGVGEVQQALRAGDPDVGEPPLLFELVGLVRSTAMCGNTPSSRPVRNTTGNSRPFALCSVINVTTSSASASRSVSEISDVRSRKSASRAGAPSSSRPRSNSSATPASSCRFSTRLSCLDRVLGLERSRSVRTPLSRPGRRPRAARRRRRARGSSAGSARRRALPRAPDRSGPSPRRPSRTLRRGRCGARSPTARACRPSRRPHRASARPLRAAARSGRPGCARLAGTRARRGPPDVRRTSGRRRRGTGCRTAGRPPPGRGTARSSGRRRRSRCR